jgi:hypothetical protein
MTKKIILLAAILLSLTAPILGQTTIVSAEEAKKPTKQDILPTVIYPKGTNKAATKLAVVDGLPKSEWTVFFANIIQFILAITGSLAMLSFTYGGVLMVTAQGQDEKLSKGRGVLMWSIIALIIIAVSFALVFGISNLKFFGP